MADQDSRSFERWIGFLLGLLISAVLISIVYWLVKEWRVFREEEEARRAEEEARREAEEARRAEEEARRAAEEARRAAEEARRAALEADRQLMREKVNVSTYDSIHPLPYHQGCPICKEDFIDGCIVHSLPCQHVFCETCLIYYISVTKIVRCPVCRKTINEMLG